MSTIKSTYLAERFLNTPLALLPAKAEALISALSEMMPYGDDGTSQAKPYLVEQGVAIIPVQGVLVQKLGSCYSYWGMTGYDGILKNFADAMNDDSVKAVVMALDSPGGDSAGCFDLVDLIYTARGKKPIWAILNENAFSAGYAIASACDKISVPRLGGTGSIGVICMIADISQALSQAGIAVNVIQFGARKADGYEVLPLADEARARFQADVDTVGELFVNTVARNRGLAASAIIAQQATTFMGEAGVRNGLADMVAAPHEAFAALLATLKT